MYTEETFYRPQELEREARRLPAEIYNLAFLLWRCGAQAGCLFVPVRSMQYLAVLDEEEFIFVHREGARHIEIAWQAFRPQVRTALTEPVPYEAVYYSPDARQIMRRLQGEFFLALRQLADRKLSAARTAHVVKLSADRV